MKLLKRIIGWSFPLIMILAVWIFLAFVPGCGCASEAMGFVWMGDAFIGCGVLVGFKDGDRTRIAFVTAKHVATCQGFFRNPSGGSAIFLKANGRMFCHRKIADIEPSRWFCAGDGLDFAWFELTEDEITSISGSNGTPCHVSLGIDDKATCNAVALLDNASLCALTPGMEVSVAGAVYLINGDAFRVRSASGIDDAVLFTWSRSAKLLEESRKVFVKSNYSLRRSGTNLSQNVIGMASRESFSGVPVFMQDEDGSHLVGLLVSSYDKAPESGYQSLHSVAGSIRTSMVSGKACGLSSIRSSGRKGAGDDFHG